MIEEVILLLVHWCHDVFECYAGGCGCGYPLCPVPLLGLVNILIIGVYGGGNTLVGLNIVGNEVLGGGGVNVSGEVGGGLLLGENECGGGAGGEFV